MSIRALNIGATGMIAHTEGLAVTANNLANLETPGFKRASATFQDLVAQNLGAGTSLATTTRDPRPGNLTPTGRPLDLAIDGQAFFEVVGPQGEKRFTRAGNFTQNADGQLVLPTGPGYRLDPPITIPTGATNITIASDGVVTARLGSQTLSLGQISATRFANPEGLIAMGNNLFAEGGASGSPIPVSLGAGGDQLRQGYLEASNVDLTSELVSLITQQQAFSVSAEVFRAANERLASLKDLTR